MVTQMCRIPEQLVLPKARIKPGGMTSTIVILHTG